MNIFGKRLLVAAFALLASSLIYATPAAAQATRTWISGVGDDVNPCSRTAPCKTFAGAISKTAAGGEINCLDPGGFGTVTITKSISIICENNPEGGITASGVNGFIINGTNVSVVIAGIDLEGLGNTAVGSGTNGITFLNGASLVVRNMKIRAFRNGYGINFAPNSNAQLFVENTIISDSGSASTVTTGGINVAPATGVTARIAIVNSQIVNNLNVGLRIDTTGIVGSQIVASINNTQLINNGSGLLIKTPASTGTADFTLTDSNITQNTGYGMIINGAATTARVGNTTITNNGTGIMLLSSAIVKSYGDNRLDGNTTADGAFSSTLPKK
ncbi:MAG: right-handed parallel beta-helix repeat-containing protein [Pseudomonadota bacterium]|uniref:hypothetical protein n=1 Tax=Sphingomonas sp. ERG5 TaxID=1381597 RepID=UPI00068C66A9|nr:hypothetical protein [Sphingomonas sp. ERG5]